MVCAVILCAVDRCVGRPPFLGLFSSSSSSSAVRVGASGARVLERRTKAGDNDEDRPTNDDDDNDDDDDAGVSVAGENANEVDDVVIRRSDREVVNFIVSFNLATTAAMGNMGTMLLGLGEPV
jgi:hypothetical protein